MESVSSKSAIKFFIATLFLFIGFSCIYGCQDKQPDFVWYIDEIKTVIIFQKPQGKAYVYEILPDGSCEFNMAIRPNSPYYPWQTIKFEDRERVVGNPSKLIDLFKQRDQMN